MRGWIAGLVLILTTPVWAADPIVTDGDTLLNGGTKFRLDGVDAPETDQICLDEKHTSYKCGVAARDALVKWIANRAIWCDDKGPDKVHPERRIGVCIVEGTNISLNQWLVREGWALNFEPYAQGRFVADQADAQKDRRGIWKGCFAAPTDRRNWRKSTANLMGPTCDTSSRDRLFHENACSIKGSRSSIYHMPGCGSYDSLTNVVQWFCSEEGALAKGFRKAKNCPAIGR